MADQCMGLSFGLDDAEGVMKRKFRWLFKITDISAEGAKCLPPMKSNRPSLSWKEYECQHVTETIWYPWKADWKPVSLVLYDVRCSGNPVFDWLKSFYSVSADNVSVTPIAGANFKRKGILIMLDGCGKTMETWTFDNCYPSTIDWGDLDMSSNDLATVDLQLRYDRAYVS